MDPSTPRHVAHVPMRWADMDAYGHVNNAVFLRYLQEARVEMLFVQAARRGAAGLAEGVVVARHEIDYLAPLRFRPGAVRVETWLREMQNSTFTLGYEIVDADESGEIYALASTTLVPYDLSVGRPRRLGEEEKAVLERHLQPDGPVPRAGRGSAGATRDRDRAPGGEEPDGRSGPPRPEGKVHQYECAVRFDDLDSYGHVNNVTFAEYIQEARIDFVARHFPGGLAGHAGSVVAGQHIDYLAPVTAGARLQVEVWVTRLGESSFDLAYAIRDAERVYARATSALVAYDLQEARPRPVSPPERAALEPFHGVQ
ncbi:acyl-CoA thioesterase [Actinobacteria bacterium YIM 96077]|uniref:Acyl-CoA thioesterase n=1 Tax=Phytoactinopolyspora halophila TaxID=1981511 RepID=A0A329QNA4_9ACTN|nr:thioesterase family protein [Phytoactinopolyspora halophila]AYY12263.1 acyl-CoA thioesterase [Actinobacteria bacterium YIM 96077]RAW13820.1 acyl-CoA thioesterase [Phytoactinopolyspora halophila]